VSFKKGCYPGQEIVARTQYLGKIKRRMYRATVAAPVSTGQDLYASETGDQSCGNVVIAAQVDDNEWECLVVLQSSAYDAVNTGAGAVHLGATDGPILSFLNLPYEN
jgi:folate-binding Fe-S cluster repair protein YgfZ